MWQHHLARAAPGRPPAGGTRCLRRSAAAELPRASSCQREAAYVHHGSTAKRSRKANTSMVATIAGLANRRSWSMLRAASRIRRLLGLADCEGKPICTQGSGSADRGNRQQAVVREPVEMMRGAALGNLDGPCHPSCCGVGMRRNVREDNTVGAVAALQKVLAEQAGRAGTDAQPSGYGEVVTRRLADPSVQPAEGKERG